MYQTPILFLIFNRPELTRQVFEKIRELQPSSLYVAGDGPRPHKPEDIDLCAQARKIVQEGIDWPCEVKYLLRDENLGCGLAISGAISWFFDQVEKGIILEDDCLPSSSFFSFCEEMLIKYSDCEDIGAISGTNFFNSISSSSSYTFSFYGGNWGWATWKRAWQHFDLDILNKHKYQNIDFTFLERIFQNNQQVLGLKNLFKNVISNYELACSTWDFQWFFIRLKNELLTIVPSINLITNIGLGGGAHFNSKTNLSEISKFFVASLCFQKSLVHPNKIDVDHDLDDRFGCFYNWIEKEESSSKEIPLSFLQKIVFSVLTDFRKIIYNVISSKSITIIGKPTCIQATLFEGNGEVSFGENVFLGTRQSPDLFSSYSYINIRNNGCVKLCDRVWTNNKLSILCNGGEIYIGKDTLIGYNVCIMNSDFHHLSYLRRKEICKTYKNIHIGDNVFIGNNVQILKGINIGNNSIVSAGSIVHNNIPENSIFSGNKIKPIHVNI